jgi:phosphoglycolate phosphatase-like HAD superfamily hydrolase
VNGESRTQDLLCARAPGAPTAAFLEFTIHYSQFTIQEGNTVRMGTIEIVRPGVSADRAKVALFDFDGTLSLIRTGWVDVMVPMMVEILVELKTGEKEEDLRVLVNDFVARLTGEQTIYQMIELTQQVKQRGGKPLAPLQYKRIYHDRLMHKIEYRREELRQGKVSPDQYLVPGARAIIENLKERGLKLYCASGTDEVYTLEEARLLEIDRYFDGRIYGARDDYKSFSKEILIRKMVSSMECRGNELVGFGDGYVEIKNIKDAGGVAVGVATDEPECRVVNQWKRERLVTVGADFIIPNFLCREQLVEVLFPDCRLP